MNSPSELPRRAFRAAMGVGAHADCLIAGSEGACEYCSQIVFGVLSHIYGDDPVAALVALIADFAVDIEEDEHTHTSD